MKPCRRCFGTKYIYVPIEGQPGLMQKVTCPRCGGTGKR